MPRPENVKPHEFKPGQSGNPNGRPKKFVTTVLQDLRAQGYNNVTKQNIADVYQTLLALPNEDLVAIGKDDKQPMICRIIARGMLSNKGFEIIEKMLDRSMGKPGQEVKLEHSGDLFSQPEITIKVIDGPNNTEQETASGS